MSFIATHLAGFGGARTTATATGNDSFTKVLLHFDGADASTTITDSNAGGNSHTWTANGNAQIDTAQSKFGGSSLLVDGTGDNVKTADDSDFTFGTSDFVVDFWFRPNSTSNVFLCGQSDSSATDASVSFYFSTVSSKFKFWVNAGGSLRSILGTTTFSTGTWYHLAGVVTSSTMKLYVNGTKEGSDVSSIGSVNNATNSLAVGAVGDYTSSMANGWFDEFRISVGTDRGWNGSSFTVPTAAYG